MRFHNSVETHSSFLKTINCSLSKSETWYLYCFKLPFYTFTMYSTKHSTLYGSKGSLCDTSYVFNHCRFMFHVSSYVSLLLKIRRFKRWNIVLQCFILCFMFHHMFHFYVSMFHFYFFWTFSKTPWRKFQNLGRKFQNLGTSDQTLLEEMRLKHWNLEWNIKPYISPS